MSLEIVVPQSVDVEHTAFELTVESLYDLEKAVIPILKDAFPSIEYDVRVVLAPYPRLVVGVPRLADNPKYPYFLRIFKRDISNLKLTDFGRRLLGAREKGTG